MTRTSGGFRAALLVGWVALGAAGWWYARLRDVPSWIALPALTAFLIAYPFYLLPGFPRLRERLSPPQLMGFLLAGTLLPYFAACTGAVPFRWLSVLQLAAVAFAVGLWYIILPIHPLTDLGFLALVASLVLGKYFDPIYPKPFKGVEVSLLGKVALIEAAVLALILLRRVPETGYGFIPNRREWKIGVLHYLYFLPIGIPLALGLKVISYRGPSPVWLIAGTFLGFLWVAALCEEFFFRGVLQHLFWEWTRNRLAALVITSLFFGSVHLWFRGFPNWRMFAVATTLGLVCGMARNQAGSIRAATVTHALIVTTWRGFFS